MTAASPPAVVLDTNAVLDWLVFRHPSCSAWEDHLRTNKVRWLATEAIRAEWLHVLGRGVGAAWSPDLVGLEAAWADHVRLVAPGPPPLTLPRCSDPDDQKFVALAVQARARWLVTRDRALLKLRRPLARHGVAVLTPEDWNSALAAGEIAQQAAG